MKKCIKFVLLALIIIASLTACNAKETSSIGSVKATEKIVSEADKSISDILVSSPMTLSNNDLFSVNGKNEYLRLKMIKGNYSEDWNPGAYMGTAWEGNFVFELMDDNGNTIAKTDLSNIYSEPLIFNAPFKLEFADYNHDGDIDFTLGQYATSNGNTFKLFTIRKNGSIEELKIKDFPTLFISVAREQYSVMLTKENDLTFKAKYYDNSVGKYYERYFKWEDNHFVLTKTIEITGK